MDRFAKRALVDLVMRSACTLATALALAPLVSVLAYVGAQGLGGLSWGFFTELPAPVGESGGGVGNALLGSLVLLGLAGCFAIPIGVLAGVYLAEFGIGPFGRLARFCADVATGVPSIIVGVFVYSLVVLSMRRFSALAGGLALGILMLPTITRTTEEILRLVPDSLREAGLALGVPERRVILRIVVPTAAPGVATAVTLALARAAGETAPLLFTALNSRFWSTRLDQPIGSLPVQLYSYALSPYEPWHRQAWATALVLVALVLTLNLGVRALTASRKELR